MKNLNQSDNARDMSWPFKRRILAVVFARNRILAVPEFTA